MSASDHFGPQLQMFIPAGAFKAAAEAGKFGFTDRYDDQSVEDLHEEKVDEAHRGSETNAHGIGYTRTTTGPTFYESVKAKGVREPVQVSHLLHEGPSLREGHHRVFVSADIDPKREVPVIHGGYAKRPRGDGHDYVAEEYPR